jgi:hypothetical protein
MATEALDRGGPNLFGLLFCIRPIAGYMDREPDIQVRYGGARRGARNGLGKKARHRSAILMTLV